MKTLTHNQQKVQGSMSTDVAFTTRFVTRNLRVLDTALKVARASLRRGKNVAIRTQAEFRRAIDVK